MLFSDPLRLVVITALKSAPSPLNLASLVPNS
jgi:hypothetical protein